MGFSFLNLMRILVYLVAAISAWRVVRTTNGPSVFSTEVFPNFIQKMAVIATIVLIGTLASVPCMCGGVSGGSGNDDPDPTSGNDDPDPTSGNDDPEPTLDPKTSWTTIILVFLSLAIPAGVLLWLWSQDLSEWITSFEWVFDTFLGNFLYVFKTSFSRVLETCSDAVTNKNAVAMCKMDVEAVWHRFGLPFKTVMTLVVGYVTQHN